jgi:hypothetical protein
MDATTVSFAIRVDRARDAGQMSRQALRSRQALWRAKR